MGRGRGLLRLAPIRLRICHEPLVERRIGSESSDACYLSHARDDIMHVNGQLARQGRGAASIALNAAAVHMAYVLLNCSTSGVASGQFHGVRRRSSSDASRSAR